MSIKTDTSKFDTSKYYYDDKIVSSVITFIENYFVHRLGDKVDTKFKLSDWQKEIISSLYGWRKVKDGKRKHKNLHLWVSRKNGKSLFISSILLVEMVLNKEKGREIYSLANDTTQSKIIYDNLRYAIENNKNLNSILECYRFSIINQANNIKYSYLSNEKVGKHGKNVYCAVFDEIHEFRDSANHDALISSQGSRSEYLNLYISTAGHDKTSFAYKQYSYAKSCAMNEIDDDTVLTYIYELDEKDDWEDEKNWYKSNPCLGESVRLEFLQQEYNKAKELSYYKNVFKQLYCGIWTDTKSEYLNMEDWNNIITKDIDLTGRDCYVAVDLSSKLDITALILLFPPTIDDNNKYHVLCKFYSTEAQLKQYNVRYSDFIKRNELKIVGEVSIDYNYLLEDLKDYNSKYNIKHVLFDVWNAQDIMNKVSSEGFSVIEFAKTGANYNLACKELDLLVRNKQLDHKNNSVLRWMASNTAVKIDVNNNVRPVKSVDKSKKDDGIIALLMALSQEIVERTEKNDDDYVIEPIILKIF